MSIGNISFDPNNPNTYPDYINQGSTRLQIQDTQIQLGGSDAASSVFSASSPSLTILGFRKLVTTATNEEEKQRIETALFESTQYLKIRYDRTLTADSIRKLIAQYEDYRGKIQKINNEITHALDDYNNAVNDYQSAVNDYTTDSGGYNDFVNTVTAFNNYDPNVDGDEAAFVANYNDKVNDYNNRVNQLNAKIAEFNQSVADYNGVQFDVAAQINNLNQAAIDNGLNVPPIPVPPGGTPIAPLTSFAITSPPAQPGVTNPNSPHFGDYANTAVYPTYPTIAFPLTYTGTQIDEDTFNNTYIDPLNALLKTIEDVNAKVEKEINFQDYFQLAFGQRNIVSGFQEPKSSTQQFGAPDAGGMLTTASSDQKSNPRLQEKTTQQAIIDIYIAKEVAPSSETLAALASIQDNALKNLVLSNILPGASGIAGSGLVGPDAPTSPSVLAGVALNALANLQLLLTSGDIFKQVVAALGANPSDDKLVELAQGITAAIKLEIAKTVILQLESALGSAGLLTQLLSNLGSLNADSILQLTQGLVSYKNAFENPFGQEALISLTSQALQESGVAKAQADQIARDAFNQAAINQANFDSEEKAKQAFLDAVREQANKDQLALEDFQKTSERIQSALNDSNAASLRFQEQLKADTFSIELKKELTQANLDKEDLDRVNSRLDQETKDIQTADDRKAASLKILSQEGVDNAQQIVNLADQSALNPLRSFVQTAPLSQTELASAFNDRVVSTLNQPGAVTDNSLSQADKFTSLLVTAPNSISNLIDVNVKEYNKQVKDDQGNKAVDLFKDGITSNWDALRLANDKYNTANFLVYSDKPAYAGIHSHVMTGGSPAGTGYVNNDKFV